MTCRDVMTSNPSCCLPSDSVAMAAQMMKREDIGPVLVVSDYNERRLIGIVTDRDLAVKVVAEGRDPHNTRVDEVMTLNPVTCREEDDTSVALNLMAKHQVRRIPVVDHNNRLVGIIAQADLARHEDEHEVGQMVEEISQPHGASGWVSGAGRGGGRWTEASGENPLLMGAMCLGIGAGLMYLMDPTRGRTRRARVLDKATGLYHDAEWAAGRTARDLRNRASGIAASTKSMLSRHPVSDEKLVARIRSKIGRYVSHPHAVDVTANNGEVTLRGAILADELQPFLKAVSAVPGVTNVNNHTEVHQEAGSHPSLQGEGRRQGESWDFMQSNWSPSTRLMAGALGGCMLLYGTRAHGTLAKATATLGLGLLTRGVTNREVGSWTNLGAARRMVGM